MGINRNVEDYTLIAQNEKYDFYVSKKKLGKDWNTEAWSKGTNTSLVMAGFSTKKMAIKAANSWAEWFK